MHWKNLPYWGKGALLAIPLSIVLIPLSLFIAQAFGAGNDIAWYVIPEFYIAALGLGMRGTPAGMVEIVVTLTVASAIFIGRFSFLGFFLGGFYGFFAKRNKQRYFVASLVILFTAILVSLSYRTQNPYNAYFSANSPQDCESVSKKFIKNFGIMQCYHELATKQGDIHICDLIKNPTSPDDVTFDARWFCYEEVAQAKNDASLCELIPPMTLNEHNVYTGRRDGCYGWFKLCEKIVDPGWRANCVESRSRSPFVPPAGGR